MQSKRSQCKLYIPKATKVTITLTIFFLYSHYSNLWKHISAHCLLCSYQFFYFFLLDKPNIVNKVPDENNYFLCLNPVSSWYLNCGVHIILRIHLAHMQQVLLSQWSTYISLYLSIYLTTHLSINLPYFSYKSITYIYLLHNITP